MRCRSLPKKKKIAAWAPRVLNWLDFLISLMGFGSPVVEKYEVRFLLLIIYPLGGHGNRSETTRLKVIDPLRHSTEASFVCDPNFSKRRDWGTGKYI